VLSKVTKKYKAKLVELKSIQNHPQYKELKQKIMMKYGHRINTTCPPRIVPCPPRKKLGDYPISNHPDIHKYILKS